MRRLRLPDGVPRGVEVYRLAYRLTQRPSSEDWALLAPSERMRAQRLRRHADRCRAVHTRACLRRLLGERLRIDPEAVRIDLDANGKPCVAYEGIGFNVSHSGSLGLIALTGGRAVGVDIEEEGDPVRLIGLDTLLLSPDERAAPLAGGLLTHWVAKEAALKALGIGLAEPLAAISVAPAAEGARDRYRLTHVRADWPAPAVWPLEVAHGYRAALALA